MAMDAAMPELRKHEQIKVSSLRIYNMLKVHKRKDLSLIFFIFFILIGIAWYVSSISVNSERAGIAIVLSGLFLLAAVLIINKSTNIVNLFFASSMILYTIGGFIGALGYINPVYENLWSFGTAILIISPLGMYISSVIILKGTDQWLTSDLIYVILLTMFLSIISIIIYEPNPNVLNLLFSDTITSFLLGLVAYHFIQIKKTATELKIQLNFLILGSVISISGLLLNLLILLFFSEGTIIRTLFPAIGMFFVVVSFTNLSTQIFSISEEETQSRILNFIKTLNNSVTNLQLKFQVSTNLAVKNISLLELPTDSIKRFKTNLIKEMNGLTLAIMVETGISCPNPITNKHIQQIKLDANEAEFMDGWKELHQIYFGDKSTFKKFEMSEKNK